MQSTIEQTVALESLGNKVPQPGRSVLDQCLEYIVAMSVGCESLHILEDRHDERSNLQSRRGLQGSGLPLPAADSRLCGRWDFKRDEH